MNALVRAEIYASADKRARSPSSCPPTARATCRCRTPIIERAMTLLRRPHIYGASERHHSSGLEYRPHRLPALALSVGDRTDRQGDERYARRRRHDVPEKTRSRFCRRGSGQLRLCPQRYEQISGMEAAIRVSIRTIRSIGTRCWRCEPRCGCRRCRRGVASPGRDHGIGFCGCPQSRLRAVGVAVLLLVCVDWRSDCRRQSHDGEFRRLCPAADFRAALADAGQLARPCG